MLGWRVGSAVTVSGRRWVVRRSGIHGRGVFATTDLEPGERLMSYRGEVIDWDEANRRYQEAGETGHTFFFDIGDDRVIDGGVGGNSARWINHGCVPNVEATVRGTTVDFHALRPIAPGAELLLDYRLVVDPEMSQQEQDAFVCRCSAESCRGTMLATELAS